MGLGVSAGFGCHGVKASPARAYRLTGKRAEFTVLIGDLRGSNLCIRCYIALQHIRYA